MLNAAQYLIMAYDWPDTGPRDYKAPHANRPTPKRKRSGLKLFGKLFKGHRP